MGNKLMIVKVVFEYFIEHFRKGEDEPYLSYEEAYTKEIAFKKDENYTSILEKCRAEIESEFKFDTTDKDENDKEFQVKIIYNLPKLVTYQILAEES